MISGGTEELVRDGLLRRLRLSQPRLVLLVAPAGFGKSALAQQFARGFGAYAACDCADATGERDLCRRFIGARATVSTSSSEGFAQLQYGLAETSAPVSADIETVLQAWSAQSDPAAFIFENVERLSNRSSLRKLFERILTRTPQTCTIVVCSRKPVPLRASKIAPPHRIVTLRAADLAFDRSEIEALFAPLSLEARWIGEIARVTRGWPIGVLMLRRFAFEGRLESSLSRLDDLAFEEMRAYLVDEVFEALSADELAALIACASIRCASCDDVAAALGVDDARDVMENLLQVSPFVSRADGDDAYEIHPLLHAAIISRYRRRCSKVALTAARAYEERRAFVRAARIFRDLGDADAAARCLTAENMLPDRRQSLAYSTLVASLDAQTLQRYPIVRGLSTYGRRFRLDPHLLRDETEAIWAALPASADFELRCNIGNPLARIMYETGRFDAAESLLASLEREIGGIRDIPRTAGEAYIARTLGCICTRSGRFTEAEQYFRKGYFAISGAERVASRYQIERAIIERCFDRRDAERRLADAAIESAFAADMPVHIVCALGEAAFGSWFAGEDERFIGYVRRLEERVVAYGMRGFEHFCAAAYPAGSALPNGTEQPNWLACGTLIAAGHASGAQRIELATAAKTAADASGDVFLRVVANVALATVVPAQRGPLLTEALIAASLIEADPPQAAVTALIAGDRATGLFAPLIARFSHGEAAVAEGIEIDVATREIRRGQTVVTLAERERVLLLALARQRRAYTRSEITTLLWPNLSDEGAREAFNSCLYRLRGRLREDIVVFEREGYRLRDDVRVDLREIEKCVRAIVPRRTLTVQEVNLLGRLYNRLRAAQRPAMEAWDWFEPVVAQIEDMRRAIGERIANESLAKHRFDQALEIGRQLVADDPCDEAARLLVMRAHLGAGDQASAMRELRAYRSVLRRELDVEPSPSLLKLVRSSMTSGETSPEVAVSRA